MKRWPTKPLGELCDVEGGNAAPQGDHHFQDGTIPFVRMKDLGRRHFTTNLSDTDDKLTEGSATTNRMKFFEPGCILFPRSGSVALNHRAILGVRACIVSHIGVLQNLRPEITAGYLYLYLTTFDMTALSKKTTGVDSIAFSDVKQIPIPVAPLAEQERIVKLLDEADELRKLRAQADRHTADLIPALFHEMFVESEDKKNQWPRTPLASLCSKIVDCPHSTPIYAMSETPYKCVRSSDIQEGKLDWSSTKYVDELEYAKRAKVLVPRPGDVVFCREGARLGNAALVTDEKQVCLGQRMMLFRVEPDIATPEFLCAFLLSPVVQKVIWNLVGGSASPHLNVGHTKEFVVALPPLPLQKEFAAHVSEIRAMQAEQSASRRRLDNLFHSLLHRAFQGQL